MSLHPNGTVHPSAVVDEGVTIGAGTRVWHFAHLLSGTVLGEHCVVGQNVMIGPDVRVGNGCKIQNNVSLYKGVTLEDEVFCGPSCVFTNVKTPRAHINRREEFVQTLVRRGATIGANATIVCGVTIGRYAFVGAGATVTKHVRDFALVVGVPARQVGWVCACGEVLPELAGTSGMRCERCDAQYALADDMLHVIAPAPAL